MSPNSMHEIGRVAAGKGVQIRRSSRQTRATGTNRITDSNSTLGSAAMANP